MSRNHRKKFRQYILKKFPEDTPERTSALHAIETMSEAEAEKQLAFLQQGFADLAKIKSNFEKMEEKIAELTRYVRKNKPGLHTDVN